MPNSLLLIEDETLLGQELTRHYRRGGWEVEWVRSLAEARRLLLDQHCEPLLILSDMNLPDGNALDLMEQIKDRVPHCEWLFLTGYGSVQDSVRALRLGAYEFLEKPCEMDRLDLVMASASRSALAQRRLIEQAEHGYRRYSPEAFVGRSSAARNVREMLARLTKVPFSAIVIAGETGTGKGLAARILHYGGKRGQSPLVELNCAALPRELLESQLFGHEAGAFTGASGRHRGLIEQADGGTLFLDEIGEMSMDLQAKLLKAIEDRKFRRLGSEREIAVDVQILAASHRDLETMVKHGEFRGDLYHRLSVFKLALPPLREVKEDLEELVPIFIAEINAKAGKQVKMVPQEVWTALRAHDWPGNVRELRNLVERCVLFADGPVFPTQWLQLPGAQTPAAVRPMVEGGVDGLFIPLDGSMDLDDMDRYIIETTLNRHQGNVTAAARALGTTRETLRYRVRKYGLRESV
ncbi:DNA-binding transcriptional response regulator, NtrC family, contains REC, AAA-type ATPase, and a Fis-type DNA-binding domains [Methylomagnum ishizawai]|uniref:DNA-binding transcriptional response regulator, NtrC family, contains REC, AAA-type ATPase, and a Fis-type DNA-binding domains n=1 Tax=Methylomagnum ishizawai TaxID=1760988 RepID=A0A1Y6D3J8_9GAMM|nr:sigma-54 dependent transcriptional regulator [Methylomagnum ishizawai]SMF94545.1 DNA-binding transcriptional response regulator, NtrC family, contains REC, AAA-type ATPase, and a Fis-type DNA-binding domains [Methylomagnum ishizawai]